MGRIFQGEEETEVSCLKEDEISMVGSHCYCSTFCSCIILLELGLVAKSSVVPQQPSQLRD